MQRVLLFNNSHLVHVDNFVFSFFLFFSSKYSVSLLKVDVNGECNVDYKVQARHHSGRVRTVLKTKDLTLCKDRAETNLGIPVTTYATEKVCCIALAPALIYILYLLLFIQSLWLFQATRMIHILIDADFYHCKHFPFCCRRYDKGAS